MKKKKLGKKKINFRLKDWGISRQRYWGCPIPIAYDEKGEIVKVPIEKLPIKLPENIELNTNGNPLDHQNEWKKININGKNCTLETDTLDTFVDSSWYFLRFTSPNMKEPFIVEDANYWMPVDQYIGGVEHAILHLLYSRFFLKAINFKIKKLILMSLLRVFLLREWFAMKLIKIKTIIVAQKRWLQRMVKFLKKTTQKQSQSWTTESMSKSKEIQLILKK